MFKTSLRVQDVADRVKRTFGDESGVQVTDSDIIGWTNAAQLEIVSKNSILKGRGTTPAISGQYNYPLSDTMDIHQIHSIQYDGSKLEHVEFNVAEERIQMEDPGRVQSGIPKFWYSWDGSSIELYPTPNTANSTITVYYNALPVQVTSLSDSLSLPDNYYNRIVEYVLAQAYELDENLPAHETKLNQFDNGLLSMNLDEEVGSTAYYPTISVSPEDM